MSFKLYVFETSSITQSTELLGGIMAEKPALDDVLKYAKGNIMRFIAQYASELPFEQKEEIEQTVYLRLCQAYENLNPDAGWKSFVFNHCRGGVLDYVKFGKGFEESKWSIQKVEEHGAVHSHKMRSRVTEVAGKGDESSDDDASLEHILERFMISAEDKGQEIKINWTLVSMMAADDEVIHAFAKFLIGFAVDEISEVFGKCRARVSQLLNRFVERLDDPELSDDIWQKQTLYAFGLCKRFGLPEVDQSEVVHFPVGWKSYCATLYSRAPLNPIQEQLSFNVG